ncbi:MAG: alpha/beta fold hydrolase [Clostridia bacterium]|nr:alpha/beta fold hydrolase [Clostridia bacterium]
MNTPELTTVRRAEKHSPVWLLSAARLMPEKPPRFGVQILYGFSEKKERWFPFMQFIAACGGAAVIHDLRGFGATAPEESNGRPAEALADFGYSREMLTDDIDAVWQACIPETPTPLPRFLFGHGMGALIAGLYAAAQPSEVSGLILSGLPHRERLVSPALAWFSLESVFTGDGACLPLLNRIAETRCNKGFTPEPASDGRYLWTTNDLAARYEFAADPVCCRPHPLRDYRNLLRLVRDFWRPSSWEKPGKTPVLLLTGGSDPVSRGGTGTQSAVRFLTDMGFAPAAKVYPDMRHDIFMDTEREVPFTDAMRFVLTRLPKRAAAPDPPEGAQ